MKQYVLDQPAPLAPLPPLAAPAGASLPSPGRWRSLLLILLLEPLALAALYLMLNGDSAAPEARASVAHVAALPAAPFAAPEPTPVAVPPPAPLDEPTSPVEAASRISHERGRYVIDLHSAPLGAVLEMMSSATKARVTGGNLFAGSSLRLTRSAVAATPQEAWQAVFSDVASFAITCAATACDVRFVSLTAPDGNGSTASRPGASTAQAAAYPAATVQPTSDPSVVAPMWGAAAAPPVEPASSEN